MPNWCYNRVTVTMPTPDHEQFLNNLFSADGPFNALMPEPKWLTIPNDKGELPTTVSVGPFTVSRFPDGRQDDRWYGWRVGHWGVKWDILTDDIFHFEYYYCPELVAIIEFDTAWCPPVGVATDLRERGFELTWEYHVLGMGVKGFL